MKFHRLICILIFILGAFCADSQPVIKWEKSFGGSGDEQMSKIIQTSDSGYLAIGTTNSIDQDVTESKGDYDIWLIKLSESGDLLWQKNYGGSGGERSGDVMETRDGNIVILGSTTSTDGDVTPSKGGLDFWIAKLTPNGEIIWENSIGGSANDIAKQVIETQEGDFVIVGGGESDDFDASGNNGSQDLWVAKVSSEGDLLWLRNYGGTKFDGATAVIELESNFGYLVVGSYADLNDTWVGNHNGWILNIAQTGYVIWETKIPGILHDAFYDVVQIEDGNYIACGYSFSEDGSFVDQNGAGDAFVYKVTNSGTEYWRKLYGGSKFDYAAAVYPTDNFGFVFTGVTESSDGDVEGLKGVRNIWIGKVDIFGDLEWQKVIGSGYYDEARSILQSANGDFVVAGETAQVSHDVTNHYGGDDIWIVKLGEESSSASEAIIQSSSLYPNPATNYLHIDIENCEKSYYQIFDITGRKVKNGKVDDSKKIDIEELENGYHTISIKKGIETYHLKFLKS